MFAESAPDGEGVLLQVKVVPGASRSEVAGVAGGRLRVRIAAPPERGRANEELCRLLAQILGLRKSDVSVVRGATAPQKTVLVRRLAVEAVRAALGG